jgi:hypothetical protein
MFKYNGMCNLCSSRKVREYVSHPYKASYKITLNGATDYISLYFVRKKVFRTLQGFISLTGLLLVMYNFFIVIFLRKLENIYLHFPRENLGYG